MIPNKKGRKGDVPFPTANKWGSKKSTAEGRKRRPAINLNPINTRGFDSKRKTRTGPPNQRNTVF